MLIAEISSGDGQGGKSPMHVLWLLYGVGRAAFLLSSVGSAQLLEVQEGPSVAGLDSLVQRK